ncbi:MAG TPA: hypothetical protein VFA15_09345 [Nitrososphaera sp.]|nr:hypothetical protein [Nitrososphaera sp.]
MRDLSNIKKSRQSGSDALFSLSSGYVTLELKLGLKSTGRCAIAFKSVSGSMFYEMEQELRKFLDSVRPEFNINYNVITDSYGYMWVAFDGQRVEDLLPGVNAVADTVVERGFKDQLLAAVFEFQDERGGASRYQYLIYNYKRNCFYPFVPTGADKRDSEAELKIMSAAGEEDMPFEKDMSLWYPIWNLPLKTRG